MTLARHRKTQIRDDLLIQLKRKGVSGKHFIDLVNDYVSLWEIKNMLIADIKKRGVSIYWCNGGGQEGWKKNDSIAELNKTNNQMLKILKDLDIKPEPIEPPEEDIEM